MFKTRLNVRPLDKVPPPKSAQKRPPTYAPNEHGNVPGRPYWLAVLDVFCETTSCHGLAHIRSAGSWTSVALWTVLLGFSIAAVGQQLSCAFLFYP